VQETLARGKTALCWSGDCADAVDWAQCRGWFGARFEGVGSASALSDVERRANGGGGNGEARVLLGRGRRVLPPGKYRAHIVDEKQENSFKQETAGLSRRDWPIVRAKMEGAGFRVRDALDGNVITTAERKYELLTLASRVATFAGQRGDRTSRGFQQTHQTSPISAALHGGIQNACERTQGWC